MDEFDFNPIKVNLTDFNRGIARFFDSIYQMRRGFIERSLNRQGLSTSYAPGPFNGSVDI